MSDVTNGNGAIVNYSTKELLNRIDLKLDALSTKLDTKADRVRVHELGNAILAAEGRMAADVLSLGGRLTTLELEAVRRDGPIMTGLHKFERVVADIQRETEQQRKAYDRRWRIRERVIFGVFALLSALAIHPIHFG